MCERRMKTEITKGWALVGIFKCHKAKESVSAVHSVWTFTRLHPPYLCVSSLSTNCDRRGGGSCREGNAHSGARLVSGVKANDTLTHKQMSNKMGNKQFRSTVFEKFQPRVFRENA
jgi:hypothetical protein